MTSPFFANDVQKEQRWDEMYRNGFHLTNWHRDYPGQELVATVVALDLQGPISVVDLGCGAGAEAVFLAQCGFRVHAIDFSQRAIDMTMQRARHGGVQMTCLRADVLDLPLPNASVRLANDRGCFHHIAHEQRPRYADEIARILEPGGWLLLRGCNVPNTPPWIAIDPQQIHQLFDPARFIVGRILAFQYDCARPIPGYMTLIQRR